MGSRGHLPCGREAANDVSVVPRELGEAVTIALVRDAPRSLAVLGAVDQAAASVAVLKPDLAARARHRLVATLEDCHRVGLTHSPWLEAAYRSTAVALQIDPHLGVSAFAQLSRPRLRGGGGSSRRPGRGKKSATPAVAASLTPRGS
jgi:hypothetical protein